MRPKLLFILMIYGITFIIFSLKYQLKLLVDWQSTIYYMQVPENSSQMILRLWKSAVDATNYYSKFQDILQLG